jgi:hypothetical protein
MHVYVQQSLQAAMDEEARVTAHLRLMQDSLTSIVTESDTSKACVPFADITADPQFESSTLIGIKAPVGTRLGMLHCFTYSHCVTLMFACFF